MADSRPYHIINLILAGIIGIIFLYSGLFSTEKNNHPLPSFFEKNTGQPAPSSGMSRAFSELIRGDLESAVDYNPDSPLIFAFFLVQFFQRFSVSALLRKGRIQKKHLLIADSFFSIILFAWCFRSQILAMANILHAW